MAKTCKPGERRGGRTKGTLNKRSYEARVIVEEAKYQPLLKLIQVGLEAEKEYVRASEIYDAIQAKRAKFGMIPLNNDKAVEFLKVVQKSASEIAPYIHPKLKSMEFRDSGGNEVFGKTFCEMVAILVKQKNDAENK